MNRLYVYGGVILFVWNMGLTCKIGPDTYGTPITPLVNADIGYEITFQSSKEQNAFCANIEACKTRCNTNPIVPGSKVPCRSKKYNLTKLCYESCHQAKAWQEGRKSDSNGAVVTLPLYGWCSTYINCLKDKHTRGWPFQCASIYCAYIDLEDSVKRDVALYEPDQPLAKESKVVKETAKEKDEAFPDGFEEGASEF